MKPPDRPEFERILRALQEFISAPTWAESRRVLEQHPEILDDGPDALLEELAQARENLQARQAVEEHRTLLRRCRQMGIDAAFAGIAPPARDGKAGPTIPSAFQADVRRAMEAEGRYRRTSNAGTLDEAVAAWERILRHPDLAASEPNLRLATLNDAGGTYLRRYWAKGHVEDLDRALGLWQQAVELTPPGSPGLPPYLSNLAIGLMDHYARTGELSDLEKAIPHYEQAVELTPAGSPNLHVYLNNLGDGLRDRYARMGEMPDLERPSTTASRP
jgi:tetratricopeptide (TPR) repeat protein